MEWNPIHYSLDSLKKCPRNLGDIVILSTHFAKSWFLENDEHFEYLWEVFAHVAFYNFHDIWNTLQQ